MADTPVVAEEEHENEVGPAEPETEKPKFKEKLKEVVKTAEEPAQPEDQKIEVVGGNTHVLTVQFLSAINKNILLVREELVKLNKNFDRLDQDA